MSLADLWRVAPMTELQVLSSSLFTQGDLGFPSRWWVCGGVQQGFGGFYGSVRSFDPPWP
ncbi:hypothetical protein BS78_04G127100 [Paspalum vaginatum]|nr:hypothetical protein BS78_04G127100 [Paspalum vaginatum]